MTLESIYMVKYLDFIELLNDQTIIMGFKADQSININKNAIKNGKTFTEINIDKNGFTAAHKQAL